MSANKGCFTIKPSKILQPGKYAMGSGTAFVECQNGGKVLIMGRHTFPINRAKSDSGVWSIDYMAKGKKCRGYLLPLE